MRHIIKGNPTQIERSAMEAALKHHQAKYGDYAPSKESENYTVLVDGMKIVVEIMNRKKSYVATSMMLPRDLSKVWGNAA
ncbi:MAG: DUF4060 family protein [Enterobacterales bacterium]|nr:DUF4060 family protein [Enterobacterales bacterium]MDN5971091.1 DUF4060 family protein [Enterobacterales bacterium]MDN6019682.1 DUF4060 family protein [Enterobacterales bacterium]MDN6110449.1 DUF4060 family protein [Enterobacterales bacterium]MDN6634097.1 DUF4060 family protein [Enterobacterales bacterium]